MPLHRALIVVSEWHDFMANSKVEAVVCRVNLRQYAPNLGAQAKLSGITENQGAARRARQEPCRQCVLRAGVAARTRHRTLRARAWASAVHSRIGVHLRIVSRNTGAYVASATGRQKGRDRRRYRDTRSKWRRCGRCRCGAASPTSPRFVTSPPHLRAHCTRKADPHAPRLRDQIRNGRKDVGVAQPRVLVVAPLSGHFATLLRSTVRTLLPDHDAHITDWHNARDMSLENGVFGFNEYVAYVVRFLEALGPGAHVVAVCAAHCVCVDEHQPPLQRAPGTLRESRAR